MAFKTSAVLVKGTLPTKCTSRWLRSMVKCPPFFVSFYMPALRFVPSLAIPKGGDHPWNQIRFIRELHTGVRGWTARVRSEAGSMRFPSRDYAQTLLGGLGGLRQGELT